MQTKMATTQNFGNKFLGEEDPYKSELIQQDPRTKDSFTVVLEDKLRGDPKKTLLGQGKWSGASWYLIYVLFMPIINTIGSAIGEGQSLSSPLPITRGYPMTNRAPVI